jgi:hypothetical protein
MNNSLEVTIKSSILDRDRKLSLKEEFIEFEDKDLIGASPTRLVKSELSEFRYGIKWISGIHLTIGRVYTVDIRDIHGNEINLRLKSLYGVRKKQLLEKYVKIVSHLYDQYFNDISRDYLDKFLAGESVSILGVEFTAGGVILNKKIGLIRWEDLETRSYWSYYTLSSKLDSTKYKAYVYLEDWNTGVLYTVSREILKGKGLWSD